MSRYTARLANGQLLAWGFDRPLQEYFLTLYKKEEDLEDDEGPGLVFCLGSYTTLQPHPTTPDQMKYSNTEILTFMEEYPEIPKDHKDAVALDIPY